MKDVFVNQAADASRFDDPFQRNGVRVPGMPVLPPNIERHPIPGGGSRAVEIEAGDIISVLDVAGAQPVELALFLPDGRSDAGMLDASLRGRVNDTEASLERSLAEGDASGRRVCAALKSAGFDVNHADVVRVLDGDSFPGEMRSLTASSNGLLIVAAISIPLSPHEQGTATDLVLYLERARPRDESTRILNRELDRFGVRPRGGWPAINFFSIRCWMMQTRF